MKNLLIILSLFLLSLTASAQRMKGGGYHGGYRIYRPIVAYGSWYPYGYYNPFYYPYYYNPDYSYRYPRQLEMKLDAIRDDYQQQIKETRRDKSMSRKERRAKIHELKNEKDRAVIDAKRDYFKDVRAK
ncbi:MAG TPA: hypothetical protein VHN59_08390 [Chitinophagaceae bacterium]|nr:hypothetical protein [Chitinophagaceae bacterium]